ncbi:MAG: sensor histidine kinase [Bacteroidales bacterium]
MNAFSIISAIVFLLYLQMGIYVFLKNRTSRINQMFLGLCLSFALWAFGYIFVFSAPSIEYVLGWDLVAMPGYALFPAFMVGFNIYMSGSDAGKILRRSVFTISVLLALLLIVLGFMGFGQPAEVYYGTFSWLFMYDATDPYYLFFYIYVGLAAALSGFFLLAWSRRIDNQKDRLQFRFIFYPFLFSAIITILFDVVLPSIGDAYMPMIGHLASFPWLAGIAVAIVKFQFMRNPDHVMASQALSEIREIVIFIDDSNHIVRTNRFTNRLLGIREEAIQGQLVSSFFDNQAMVNSYLQRIRTRQHLGPVALTLTDQSGNHIETSLSLLAIQDTFNDYRGCILYGHDNREALNLQKEIIIRQHAEKNLRSISEVLETRVKERTRELANSYKELQVKMTERMRIEEQIKADIAEKEILINEIHNRVKNNMNIIISLINAQDKKNTTRIASQKFNDLAQRVRTLLIVHQHLYLSINYSDVDFASFLKTISQDLLVLHKRTEKVEIRLEVSDVFLDVDYAIPMGIIVNELISNALQHGFSSWFLGRNKGRKNILFVEYLFKDGVYEISVNDNGKGLPEDFDIQELTTNGLPLVEILVNDQINGSMEVFTSSEGTLFKVTFKAVK